MMEAAIGAAVRSAIGAAGGLIGSVVNKLSYKLVEAYVASSELGLNYKKIIQDLMLTQGLLHEAQRRGVSDNPGLQGLVQQLSGKADEAEDTLDELHYFIIQDQLDGTQYAVPDLGDGLRGQAQHGGHAVRHTVGNWLPCFSCCRKEEDDCAAVTKKTHNPTNPGNDNDAAVDKLPFDRVAMSKKIKSVIEEMHSLCDPVSKLLNIIPHHSSTTVTLTRSPMGSITTQHTLYGRTTIFEKTLNDITSGTYQFETLSVLPIVGPGGIGKTTFTQHLFNDKRIQEHFAVKVWVCVSTDFDVSRLTKHIHDCILGTEEEESNTSANKKPNLVQLQTSIAKKLKSRKFLIVLDDIWECNSEDWENLLAPFMNGDAKGNMVLVTTRFPSKAEMVKTTNPIALEGLEPQVFFTFFEAFIFGGNKPKDYQDDLSDVARNIANKLKGSPLAAKTVGRLLKKELSREHWIGVLENNEWQKQKNANDIMPSLRISYDYLPFHLKKCFPYFSLFPEDYRFNNLEITYFWIAIGIIDKDENYMEELVDNGFLIKEVDIRENQYYVMHDLLHELSQSVSSQECLNICSSNFRTDVIPQTIRHLSVTMEFGCDKNFRRDMIKLRSKIDIRNLRALMIFGEYDETIDGILKDSLKEIEGLRVLFTVVDSPESLPRNFSKLIHLRYLKITASDHEEMPLLPLPSTISRFYHLKLLELRGQCRYKLPKDMSRLINLCHLFVRDHVLQSNVPEVGKMKCLKELEVFYVKKESVGFELSELGELTELGGELSIYNLEKVSTKEEAMEAKLVWKRDLKILRLGWHWDASQHITESDVIDGLEPPPNLQELSITDNVCTTCPRWFCGDISTKMLVSLYLDGVLWGTLPPFGQLPLLTTLTLRHIYNVREISPGFGGAMDKSFMHLKRIVLDTLPELTEWVGAPNALSFSRLEYIKCRECPNLCVLPFLQECSGSSYTHLSQVEISDCPKLSLPPMPHTPTLTSFSVQCQHGTKLCYLGKELEVKQYDGELALHNLDKVETMSISGVSHISLTRLNKLRPLIRLSVWSCGITCHGLQDLTRLQSFTVYDCGNFFGWPKEESGGGARTINPVFNASLRDLSILSDSSMKSLALLSNLTSLARLRLEDCENITVEGFNPLITVNLKQLCVYNRNYSINGFQAHSVAADLLSEMATVKLPVGSFHRLTTLEVDSISAVLVAPICTLLAATLRTLQISCDRRKESFTEEEEIALQLLTSLQELKFGYCEDMPSLPEGLHHLPSLRELRVYECLGIRALPKRGFPTSLRKLEVIRCSAELKEQAKELQGTYPLFTVCTRLDRMF